MKEIKSLVFLELRAFMGINKIIHSKDSKEKRTLSTRLIAWLILLGMLCSYMSALAIGLCELKLSSLVPAYLTLVSTMVVMLFSFLAAGSRIFGQKGYDIIASMPIKTSSVVISRFIAMYIENLIFSLAIMISGTVAYGISQKPHWSFYVISTVGACFIPAIPLVISSLFGTLLFAVTSRMKKKSMMQSFISVFLVVGIMAISFGAEGFTKNFSDEQFSNLAKTLGDAIKKFYPPALWLNTAILNKNILMLLLFSCVSIGVIALAVFLVSLCFKSIMHKMMRISAKHNYKLQKTQSRGLLKALYFKEAKRYFSSAVYVTNTIIGPIMGAVLSVALCIFGIDKAQASLPIALDIKPMLSFALSSVLCMMTTTSCSISMEGKQFEFIKSLPIPTRTWLNSKMLFNISLILPFYAVSAVALSIATKPSPMELVWIIVIPLCIMLFSVVFGIFVNLRMYRFDWQHEAEVVKQSIPAMLGGFAPFIVSIGFGAGVMFIPERFANIAHLAICLILLAVTAIMYITNNKKKIEKL